MTALGVAVGIPLALAVIIWLAGRWVPDRPPVTADMIREYLTRTEWGPDADQPVPYLPAEVADFDQWQAELEDQR